MVFDRGEVDLCLEDPGFEVDLHVRSSLQIMTEVWLGHRDLADSIRSKDVELEGPVSLMRSFRRWFALSPFARAEAGA